MFKDTQTSASDFTVSGSPYYNFSCIMLHSVFIKSIYLSDLSWQTFSTLFIPTIRKTYGRSYAVGRSESVLVTF